MILYNLFCNNDHEFEAWFRNSDAFDTQLEAGQLVCPHCDSDDISKALMAPNVVTQGVMESAQEVEVQAGAPDSDQPVQWVAHGAVHKAVQQIRDYVEENADYVGDKFADEARKIHHEEAESRGIYGEATTAEIEELNEEGVLVCPLPALPEEQN